MKNKNIMSSLTGRSKIFLLICLFATFFCDLTCTVILLVQENGNFYMPLLFTVADAVFLTVAALSNFRFSYTVKHLIIYLVCSALLYVLLLNFGIFGGTIVYTDFAAGFSIAVHALAIAGTLVCYLYAAKRIRGNIKAQTAVTAIFTALYIAVIILYSVSLFALGYFGQGGVHTRTLEYLYDGVSDTYEVTGVAYERTPNVYIPKKFNGKKISKVSSSVFLGYNVRRVTLDCAEDVEFTGGFSDFVYGNESITVYTFRDKTEIFKKKFYDIYIQNGKNTAALKLANAVVPADLKADEVYISFAYDEETFEYVKDAPLPTYIGKRGEVFDTSYFGDIPYAKYSDPTNDKHLLWNFENNNKNIMCALSARNVDGETVNLNGSAIEENFRAVPVNFERVYKVFPGESNDTVHTTDLDFGFSEVNGGKLPYKLTVCENADKILQDFKRDGFDVSWRYSTSEYPDQHSRFNSLSQTLSSYGSDDNMPEFTIYPQWKMLAPEVTLTCDGVDNTYIYGDEATITAAAKSNVKDVVYEYEWRLLFSELAAQAVYENPFMTKNDEGRYDVSVTAKCPDSSLTASAQCSVYVTVNPRPVYLDWTYPENNVFDGEYKSVDCAIREGCAINGDEISLVLSSFLRTLAGKYRLEATLTGFNSDNYTLVNGTAEYTIEKAPLTVDWSGELLVYNAKPQSPEISVSGLIEFWDDVSLKCNSFEDAGTHEFTATLSGGDASNYYLTNPESTVEIKPFGVTVEWKINGSGDTVIYNGTAYSVTASAKGIGGEYLETVVSQSYITDAGTYEISATLKNQNYAIVGGQTHIFVIKPRAVSVSWNNGVTGPYGTYHRDYNGEVQKPVYSITGPKGEKLTATVKLTSVGNSKDVGSYEYTAEIAPSASYNVNNYTLDDSKVCKFVIDVLVVDVQWVNTKLEYNGKRQIPEAYVNGAGSDGIIPLVVKSHYADSVNAGNHYTAIVNPDDQTNPVLKNYSLHSNGTDYEIIPRTLTYKATDVTIYQGDELPALTYISSGFIDGSTPGIVVSDIKIAVEGYTGEVGKYVNSIKITGKVSGEGKDNYKVVFECGTLTVLPREG